MRPLLEIAEKYVSAINSLEQAEKRISCLVAEQVELNEKILEIEEEWGKLGKVPKGRISRVVSTGEEDIPLIELSKSKPKVIDLTKEKIATRLFTEIQSRYCKLVSKKIRVNAELENLEEERKSLYESVKSIEPKKLLEMLEKEEKKLKEEINLLSEVSSKIVKEKRVLEENLTKDSKKIKEVSYKFGANIETAVKWYFEDGLTRFLTIPETREKVEEILPFLKMYVRKMRFDYLEKYFSSLNKTQQEELAKTENYIEILKNLNMIFL